MLAWIITSVEDFREFKSAFSGFSSAWIFSVSSSDTMGSANVSRASTAEPNAASEPTLILILSSLVSVIISSARLKCRSIYLTSVGHWQRLQLLHMAKSVQREDTL